MGSLSIAHWVIIIGIIYLISKAFTGTFGGRGRISKDGSMVCPSCGSRGEPKTITKGSTGIELILWLCLLVPGLIYSIWRLSSRVKGCPSCGSMGMIPANSPHGKKLIDSNQS